MNSLKQLKREARKARQVLTAIEETLGAHRRAGTVPPETLCVSLGEAHRDVNLAQAKVRKERERMRKAKKTAEVIAARVHERVITPSMFVNGVYTDELP